MPRKTFFIKKNVFIVTPSLSTGSNEIFIKKEKSCWSPNWGEGGSELTSRVFFYALP